MEPTDTTYLVRGAKSGDADSLAGLVARFTPLLEMQARHRLAAVAPDVDPADCVQETWLRALPRLPELGERDGRGTPVLLKFLATTLLHCVQEVLRSRIRQHRERDSSDAIELPAATRGVVSRVLQAERHGQLWSVLADLDPAERELLILRGIEQHDNKAIAQRLGESENAVSLRYNRLLRRLRDRIRGTILDEI